MLEREHGEQQRVDDERLGERATGAPESMPFGTQRLRDEADGVEDGGEGDGVGAASEHEEDEAEHWERSFLAQGLRSGPPSGGEGMGRRDAGLADRSPSRTLGLYGRRGAQAP